MESRRGTAGLISFWVEGTNPDGPHGFGVTAWSVEDALSLIDEAGYLVDPARAVISTNVRPHEVDFSHVALNSGPAVFRGVWYPCRNVGWGASGQR